MSHPSAIALTGFIAWTLLLLIVMEILRVKLVASGQVAATAFTPDNANLSPFMQRLARAHANCIESLPVSGGLLLVALVAGHTGITDPLAYTLLAARLLQSCAHLASSGALAVNIRFLAFAVQMLIGAYWALRLLAAMIG
ncbi:MAPEG family protein [Flavobacterium sp. MXW15]|uniref:MAPEG family protein n=1 Tax=Xanthomonas chitinilytica TaxID=2989819 RepID=A0ABT3JXH1_9XANT|nr:MAPEG family protein [Xanthomonas sp. H13-6]MCW4455649.1 MAPEG family protein [Flavobacterium sp. MXW15]MCW4472865.1 MAPEG family protein [Xanthomonas sp. H13-6]